MDPQSSTSTPIQNPVPGSGPTSFGWANGEPLRYKDATKARQKAHALASELLTARDDDIEALVARKRKTYEEQQPRKRQRQMKPPKDESTTADDEIEWSDCDEAELSRNISLLERSINNPKGDSKPSEDTDLEWSDCDEAELSRFLEQSINN